MSQLKVSGLEKVEKAMEAKRRYLLRIKGAKATKVLISPALASQSLDIARKLLTKRPGKPKDPIRWKSDKQRKFVMAKLRNSGNLPYRRTGAIQRAWKAEIDTNEVLIVNEARDPITSQFYGEYVFGKDQQPFHKDTGWNKESDETTRKIIKPMVEGLFDAFKTGIIKT